MAVLESKLIVSLIDRLTAPSKTIAATLGKLQAAQTRNNAALDAARGRMLEAVGAAWALQRALAAPINAAIEFQTKLEDIAQKIDKPREGMRAFGNDLRDIARRTTNFATDIAGGMDVLAGMGASETDAKAMLEPIGKAAVAYRADITDLAKAGYAALDTLKVPAAQFGRALDSMAVAGKAGAFELADMAKYFPELGAAYQGLGQKGLPAVADLGAALQVVRKGTGDSASAATNLANILQKVYAPQTVKAFDKMGVNLRKEMKKAAKKGMTPIEALAEITNKVLKGDLSRLGDLFQDAQVQQGLRPLIQNIEEYRKIRAEALKAQGVVEQDYEDRLKTGAMAVKRWQVAFSDLSLSVGNALLPALTDLANTLVPIIDRVGKWADEHPALTRAIVATAAGLVALRIAAIAAQFSLLWMRGGLITAAIGGLRLLQGAAKLTSLAFWPMGAAFRGARTALIGFAAASRIAGIGGALGIIGKSALALVNPLNLAKVAIRGTGVALRFAFVSSGVGAIIAGIAAAGVFIYENWNGLGEMFRSFGSSFMNALGPAKPIVEGFAATVSTIWDKITGLLGPIDESGAKWRSWGDTLGQIAGGGVATLIEAFGTIGGWLSNLWEKATNLAKAIGSVFSSGGGTPATPSVGAGGADTSPSGVPSFDGRARGGPVGAGRTYWVGERGPELFTPGRSGNVFDAATSARASRGRSVSMGDINLGGITINAAPGMSPDEIARAVEARMDRKLARLRSGAFTRTY